MIQITTDRKIASIPTVSVENDKDVVRLEFSCANQVTPQLKLTDCDKVYINYSNADVPDRYLVTDLTVAENGNVVFSWLLGRNAVHKSGTTYFVVCAQKLTEAGEIEQEWNTELTAFPVRRGLETLTQPAKPYADIFSQIFTALATKLVAENIIAGTNITLDVSGNNIIINSTGGASFEVDNVTLENVDGVLKVKNGGVNTNQLANGAVNSSKIAESGVRNTNIADSAVTIEKLASGSVDSTKLGSGLSTYIYSRASQSDLSAEVEARQNADVNLQGQIDAITVSSDVIDVVGTYADLQNYDTQHVKANDIIKVLQDSTHNDALSYYRWVITEGVGAWVYVGSEGPFYTKSEADTLLNAKQDALTAGNGIDITGNVISAINKPFLFVASLPLTNIQTNTLYFTPADKLFPDTTGIMADDLFVTKVDGEFKACKINGYYMYGSTYPLYKTYTIYHIVDGTWAVEEAEQTNNGFGSKMGVPTVSDVATNVWYSKRGIYAERQGAIYDTANNRANANGTPTDSSLLNPYIQEAFEYVDNAWVSKGVFDFTKLFDKVTSDVNDKLDKTAVKQTTGSSQTDVMSQKVVTDELSGKANAPLVFSNITVATTDWVVDSTYTDYGYKAVLTCSGVTANMVADVYLNSASASLGVVASFCDEGTDSVTIYATTNENAITIDKVVAI